MKTLAIIGSTGSIGKSSINVYKKHKNLFNLVCLAANKNFKKLSLQKKKYKPKNIVLFNNKKNYGDVIPFQSFLEKFKKKKIDYVISGISGYDAININLNLLKISKNLLIANKETIICGGQFFKKNARKNKCKIVPIDSEHHCINLLLKNFLNKNDLNKLYLIASGGPFFKKKIKYNEKIKNVLNHPTWKMGRKITVDSSTFANKILELFEAKILFDVDPKKIDILIEPSSHFHTILKLYNNIFIPVIHKPKMELTISTALEIKTFDNYNIDGLNFSIFKSPKKKFPIIDLGLRILRKYHHSGMIIFTVLNERFVNLYLAGKINYGDIAINLVKAFKKKDVIKKSKLTLKNFSEINQIIKYATNIKI